MSERAIRDRGRSIRSVTAVGSVVALMFALTACGGDDESAGKSYALVPSTEAAGSPVPEKAGSPASKDATLCALAEEMNRQQSFPTVDQLTEYQELAPAAIEDAVAIAAPAFIAAGGDAMKFFVALADDDVEEALAEVNAWETENCGIDHDGGPGGPLEGGATREREDGATVVDVVATDYAFRIGGDAIAPGRTSLLLTNKGEEAHFMQLFKLAKGATMKQVMASDDGGSGLIDGSWDSGVAAPGGEDEEFLTLDLEPGTYGVSCYISTADGTPHASLGMTAEFTVS